MEDKVLQGYLYDFYGELLNEHQRSIYEDYVLNDLSLSEIAEASGVSRQGVHDMIKRCTKTLRGYEDRLHLIDKFLDIKSKVSDVHNLSKNSTMDNYKSNLSRIEEITNQILEEL